MPFFFCFCMALDLAFGAYYQTDIPKSSRSLQNLYWIQWLSEPSKIQLRTDLDFSCVRMVPLHKWMLLMRLTSLSLKPQKFMKLIKLIRTWNVLVLWWIILLIWIHFAPRRPRPTVRPFDQRYKTETDSILGKCFSNVHLDFLLFLFASPELLTDLLAFL